VGGRGRIVEVALVAGVWVNQDGHACIEAPHHEQNAAQVDQSKEHVNSAEAEFFIEVHHPRHDDSGPYHVKSKEGVEPLIIELDVWHQGV